MRESEENPPTKFLPGPRSNPARLNQPSLYAILAARAANWNTLREMGSFLRLATDVVWMYKRNENPIYPPHG